MHKKKQSHKSRFMAGGRKCAHLAGDGVVQVDVLLLADVTVSQRLRLQARGKTFARCLLRSQDRVSSAITLGHAANGRFLSWLEIKVRVCQVRNLETMHD